MFKRIFTLYIEDSYIAAVVTWGRKVKRFATIPLPDGAVKDGVVVDAGIFSQTVERLLETAKIRRSKITVCFNGARSYMRLVTLPDLPAKLMNGAVYQEAEKLMPVPLDTLYLAWCDIGLLNNKRQVFILATPRQVWDSTIPVLRKMRLDPEHIDIKPLALAWAVGLPDSLICDVQNDSADFVIVREGIPHTTRRISLKPTDNAEETAQNIAEELEKTLALFHSTYPDKALPDATPLYLSGKVSEDHLLELFILREIGRRGVLLPLTGLPDIPWQQYTANLGLLRKNKVFPAPLKKGLHRGFVKLNLLPLPYRPKQISRQRLIFIGAAVAGIAGLVPLFSLVSASAAEVDSLQARLTSTSLAIQRKQLAQKEITSLEKAIADIKIPNEKMDSLLTRITDSRRVIDRDLSQIVINAPPSTVRLTSVKYSGITIEIKGTAESMDYLLSYGSALRESRYFTDVAVTMIQKTDQGVEFTLVVTDDEIPLMPGAK